MPQPRRTGNKRVARRLILLRHGETTAKGTYVGVTEVGLSKAGVTQVQGLAPQIQALEPDEVWCSPLGRCRHTLELLQLDHAPLLKPELREVDFGRWEGLDFAAIQEQDPELVRAWARERQQFCFPGGDCLAAFQERIAALAGLLFTAPAATLLLVTHGGVIRGLICELLGLEPSQSLLFAPAPGRYARLELADGYAQLSGFNLGGP